MSKKFLTSEGLSTLWQLILQKLSGKADTNHTHSNYATKSFAKVKAGSTTVESDSASDTLEIEAGTGVTVSGDATNDKVTIGLGTSGATAGTYKSVTVDTYGRVTAGSNPNTLSGYGITDAKIANGTITLGGNSITPITSLSGYVTTSAMNTAINNAVNNAVDSVYQFKAVIDSVEDLPEPEDGRIGDVYSIKEGFILDERFVEFADDEEKTVGAGTDVVIVETGEGRKFNIMYKEDIDALTTSEIEAICQ